MEQKKLYASVLLFVTLLIILSTLTSAAEDAWTSIEKKVRTVICSFKAVFASTAVGVAALIMVMSGVQWVSSENDPGTRKKAKTSIIHAIVGLIIILLADAIAGIVFGTTINCTI